MQLINALAFTPEANDWLVNSRQPKILYVFDHACNLINEGREVLSIVTPQIGNGPFNLVVENEILFSEHLNIESQVSILDNQIMLSGLTISTANAQLWNPRPDWEKLHGKREEILSQLLSLPITDYKPTLPHSLLTTFSTSLANTNISTSVTLASQLAGLGIGLTPSGDDFIIGAMYATWIIHPSDIARVIAEEITNTAAPLTTSLSAAWLRSTGRGEAGILWHDFFDALISDNSMRIQESMDKILSIGETSGADALAGFFGVCIHPHDRHQFLL